MVPKTINPHALAQDVERTTRSDIAKRAGSTPAVDDEETHALKRRLDTLLQDTWADTLAQTSHPPKAKKRRNISDGHDNEGEQLVFRLLSSMKQPRPVSLRPEPPPPMVPRAPDCEDDAAQAEMRRVRSLSVAVDFDSLGDATASTSQPVNVGASLKVPLVDTSLAGPLPPLLVTEETRARRPVWRRGPRADRASPHEPRPSCVVLPVMSIPDQREMPSKKRRKAVRERPPPAYWRPPPGLRGKCMGYALGYPSSWAPDQHHVRDTMKKGVEFTPTCHAVHD